MKWSPHPPRTPSDLPESSHQRLNMYSLTAGAAGVGMLALAQPSEAKVIYTPAHVKFGRNTEFLLDLNHDGITDFHLINNFSNFGNRNSYRFFVSAYNQPNSIRGMEDATTGMSSGGVSAEMGIGLPRNATEESLYCAATSRAAVSQGMAELHRNFAGFNAQRL